jgi:hypothetical protein
MLGRFYLEIICIFNGSLAFINLKNHRDAAFAAGAQCCATAVMKLKMYKDADRLNILSAYRLSFKNRVAGKQI